MNCMAKFVELVLAALQFQAEGLLTIADILLSTPEETRRWFHRIPAYEKHWFKTDWAETYRNRQQFYRTLNHLKHQGLAAKRKVKGEPHWTLTSSGKEKVRKYEQMRKDPFSSRTITFSQSRGEGTTIVAFDIPEKERRKRDWIRMCLRGMGFEMLQQSVWVAQGSVDEEFLHALLERKLLGYLHIFAVTKQGIIRPEIK